VSYSDLRPRPGQRISSAWGNKLIDILEDHLSKISSLALVQVAKDDSLASAGTAEVEVKSARFYKSSDLPISKLFVVVSLWTTAGTAYANFYVDDETSPRLTLTTASTTEAFLSGSIDVSGLADGQHKLSLRIYSTAGTAYTKYFEVVGRL